MHHWRPSRWQRSETWRSPSSPQIHQKYTYMWNNSYRTPTERSQRISDFPKGKKLPMYLGRAKEKTKTKEEGRDLHHWEGAVKEEKFPHTRKPLHWRRWGVVGEEDLEPWKRAQQQGCRGQSGEIPAQKIGADQPSPAREACLLTLWGGWGLGAEARASEVRPQGEDWGWRREHSLKGASAPQLARRKSRKKPGTA